MGKGGVTDDDLHDYYLGRLSDGERNQLSALADQGYSGFGVGEGGRVGYAGVPEVVHGRPLAPGSSDRVDRSAGPQGAVVPAGPVGRLGVGGHARRTDHLGRHRSVRPTPRTPPRTRLGIPPRQDALCQHPRQPVRRPRRRPPGPGHRGVADRPPPGRVGARRPRRRGGVRQPRRPHARRSPARRLRPAGVRGDRPDDRRGHHQRTQGSAIARRTPPVGWGGGDR